MAVHLACQNLRLGACDMALAGGVSIQLPPRTGYLYEEGGVASPDGCCRAFDAQARGTVGGSGAGIVVLKRLSDALAHGDTVHAVLLGSAANNDGASGKAGYTAPSVAGQSAVIAAALADAGVSPETIGYVEAHGTATPLGDPIEVAALTQAFRRGTGRTGFCLLGSVKTNVGHLDAAAGVTGLIKTVLALEHRQIPPSLHFKAPNPAIDFAASPFRVVDRLTDWEANGAPRRAGVSAFGIGGTNVHAVLEEAPPEAPASPSRPWQVLLLSARTPAALERMTDALAARLTGDPDLDLADVAHTLRVGRRPFAYRRAVLAASAEAAAAALLSRDPRQVWTGSPRQESAGQSSVAFLLPGVGDQYPGLARGLYRDEPVFRQELDRCAELLLPHLGLDLREVLFAAPEEPTHPSQPPQDAAAASRDLRALLGRENRRERQGERERALLRSTRVAQPAMFAVGYCLARLWMSWGVKPAALLGYSLGEYTAACLSGVMELSDALALVARRARLIGELPPGALLAVPLSPEETRARLTPELALAAINGPEVSVVSGPPEAVAALAERLAQEGIPCRRLQADQAFHSPMMQPIAAELAALLRAIPLAPPRIPWLSNVTGTWISPAEARDPDYWVRHLLSTVRFADGVAELWRQPGRVLLEMGPGQTLGSLALQQAPSAGEGAADRAAFSSLRHELGRQPDQRFLLQTLGRLWLAGVEIDGSGFNGEERRRRVSLPAYPFERQRYWIEGGIEGGRLSLTEASEPEKIVLLPAGTDPAWAAALAARGVRVVTVPVGPPSPEAVDELLGLPSRPTPAVPAVPSEIPAAPPEILPSAGHVRPRIDTPYVEPGTDLERQLAAIWSDLLGIDRVGVHDNFFDLGGHSLLGIRFLSRLEAGLGVELSLRALFEAPTVAALAVEVAELRSRGGTAGAPPLVPALVPVLREGALPLSFAQQRLWFLDQLEPGTPLYNLAAVLRVEGPLAPEILTRSLGEIVRRHEALRTVFALDGDAPVQVIRPPLPFLLPRLDLSGLPEPAREAAALALVAAEAGRPFDLSGLRGDPMLRGLLLRLGAADHVVVLSMHHIASDGWSMGLLVSEVTALYAAFVKGEPSPLPELPVQYADFAVWQRSLLKGEALAREIEWWRRQLAGLPPLLTLPTDRPRPAVQSFRGATRPVLLPAGLTRQAEELAQRSGATLFMVLLAAFQALLARYSGQDDLAVGTPVAGRTHLEVESLIGFFVNTLVLRGDLSGAPNGRELLRRVRETELAAQAHQDVPFEKLVLELTEERSLAHSPLFQVIFVLQNAPLGSLDIADLRFRPVHREATAAKFDLTLSLEEHGGELTGEIEYATDLYDAATVDRLVGHFERLLSGLIEQSDRRVAEIPLLSAVETQELASWNATARDYPQAAVHELFAEQAERSPHAVAVAAGNSGAAGDAGDAGGRQLTYAEIGRRSRSLGERLRGAGVAPGSFVGLAALSLEERVIGMLGILHAGGAYVPLDLAYPRERLAFMLEDTGAAVLVTEESLAGQLPTRAGLRDLRVELLRPAGSAPAVGLASLSSPRSALRSAPRSAPDDPCYVLYTSGSTGRPKGVVVPHRAVVRLVRETNYIEIVPEDRVAQTSNSSFDAATFEIWGALLNGARLVGVERETLLSPGALYAALSRDSVSVLFLTTALFNQTAREAPAGFAPLSALVVGGEVIDPQAARAVLRESPSTHLLNGYGPTETTTFATWQRVETVPAGETVPIGRPLANGTAYVLAAGLTPQPVGAPGELYLGGDGLAHGYHARPELTALRFVPNPFGARPGDRLYRTGDLARRRPDLGLEFLGRLDGQVKIRGFRIEPGEVEAALAALPGVRQAAVVVREPAENGAGDRRERRERRLVAYTAGPVAADDLRAALRERLPDYMVPAAFVTLDALPLTPNGKVDRKALPEPERQSTEETYQAPRTPVEEVVAGIWAELLGRERVGTGDHFFALGGHSLLAARVTSRLRRAFGVELPVRDLFEAPTVAGLAARVEAGIKELRRTGAEPAVPPLLPMSPALRRGDLPLSFAQQRLWFIDQLEPGSSLYNMPVVLRVEGPLDPAILERCLGEIVRRHEALRTVFTVHDDAPVQVIRPPAPFVLPQVDLSALPEAARETAALALVQEEAGRPFDLSGLQGDPKGDLMLRGVLLRLGAADHVVALTMHHIASDGWSLGLLVGEVTALYAAFAQGEPSPLPELPVQYADFALWQRSWLQGEILAREIEWWRRQLAGLPPLVTLPTDRPRPAVQSYRGATRPVFFPAELTRRMATLGRHEGATLFMVLLAAFQALLARLSDEDDLAVGSPMAGRTHREIEPLIGFFVNTVVLRSDLSPTSTCGELLGRVRETALDAYLHQDIPFEKLVLELAPERSLAHAPLFQAMLVLQNAPAESLEIRDLRLRPVSLETTAAKFDLTVSLGEHGGGLLGTVEYATDLYDAATVDRLIACFELLLSGMVEEPERRLGELPLLTPAEARQLRAWNETDTAYPLDRPLHAWIEDQAGRAPESVAVSFETEELTYGELVRRADRLARRLGASGCGPESRVGVLLERSSELLVALLGILKAGAAYVPLDPDHPADRLVFQDRDARLRRIVTRADLADRLPGAADRFLFLPPGEPVAGNLGGPDEAPLAVTVDPDHPAYVLYTSGSTGRPKGAVISHRAIVNRLLWMQEALRLSAADRVLQKTPVSFDVSVWELFWPLMTGARLVVARPGGHRDNAYLARLIARQEITVLHFVPSMLQLFLEEPGAGECRTLRDVVCSGEALSAELARRFAARLGRARLHNLYGPTEAAVDVTSWVCAAAEHEDGRGIPIGRPIANTRIHLLDRGLQPVPVGVPGELFIAGVNLARGYVERPDLTAERFLPAPEGREPGERLYRTGDLARWRSDGAIEYLGRLDHQVKIRGVRIELGEIEAALLSLPGVREAVVMAREAREDRLREAREDRLRGDRSEKRLVAYVVGDASAGVLRQALRERLPEAMVPAAFVTLAALPLTANGKVDRKALPAPEQPGARAGYVAPRTREEELLAAVWAQVLRLPRVGVNDNFFELGGDSILSVQIVTRARQAGLAFTVRQLFEHQTVAALARQATATNAAGEINAANAEQGAVVGEVPLTPIQRWFFAQGGADPHHFNQSLLLESGEPLIPAALELAMAAIVSHHDALRMRFDVDSEGGASGWRQENAPVSPIESVAPFHQVDLTGLPTPRRHAALTAAAAALQAGFDLAAGPLTRLCLFNVSSGGAGEPARLFWVTHHLVVDGVSWRVLVEDLEGAYRQAARGLRPTFAPKTTSFQEWARRLNRHAGSAELARELRFWRETARVPVPRLPVDFPLGGDLGDLGNLGGLGNLVGDEATVSLELTAEETAGLLQTLPSTYHSRIDDALLSSLVRALAGWTGSARLRVDLEGHGREPIFGDIDDLDDLDVSRTVGWFTSLYPVVLEAGDTDPGAALVSVKERLRAVPGRGIGYGLLRYLRDAGDDGNGEEAHFEEAAPEAEILFNYLGQVGAASEESSLFRTSPTATGPSRSPRARRTHLLDFGGIVAEGRLRIQLTYGARTHRRETAERLIAAYADALRQLLRQARESAEVFTPADFPQAGLDLRGFQQLASLLPEPVESLAGGLGLTLQNVADVYPLSPVQNGMLFHSLVAPESGVYVNQVTCTLPAEVDRRLFRQSWERLVARHGVLRTAFLWDGLDAPLQVVRRSCALPWQDLDWRDLPAAEQERRFAELRHGERHTALPLDQAPLARFSLIRLGRELAFVWTFHHLLLDGWSLPLVVQELVSVYAALRESREPELPPAPPFGDYIAWLQRQESAPAERFWRRELAGFTAPNPLGIAPPLGTAGISGYAEHEILVSREVTAELQAVAARHKLTLQAVTLGAWAVLVSRYSGDEDVVFGNVVSGRPAALPGVETMVGMFINTLPVRARVNGAEPLAPWLQGLQERQLARQEFEHSPLAQVQRWSEVPAGSPLFEALYVFENYPHLEDAEDSEDAGDGGPGSLRIGNLQFFESTNYPLTLTLTPADRISLHLTSDRARVDAEAAPRLLQHFAALLAGMVAEPERRLGDLGLLTAAETLQLRAWNATATAYPLDRPLNAWIEDQTGRSPDAVAVAFEAEQLTYGELDRQAERLARRLQALGCGPESRVGVLLERSLELLVTLLGILKAGAAYVPLDPDHPADRLAFQDRDARLRWIVTRAGLADRLPSAEDRLLFLEPGDRDLGDFERDRGPLSVRVDPDHPAYVLYTSGSTGRPKGAVISHRAIVNRLLWMQEAFGLSAEDRVLQKTPASFDVSVWELFWPLMTGARLVVARPGGHRDNAYLAQLIAGEGITVLHFVPSMLQLFLEEPGAGECRSLRDVVCSGEALTPKLVRRFASRLGHPGHPGHPRLHNLYGPTEAAVDVTSWVCGAGEGGEGEDGRSIPIGRPIANTRIHLLDRDLAPVPVGVPGELFIAGVNLARGYVLRPDLTAERFLPDPEGTEPGERVYRTGDLARRRGDGAIEFLGRLDHQVKIRGVRIELGEIEAALLALPGVREAVVLAREARGEKRLVAYVVGDAPVEALRQSLRERLPDAMVPAAFVPLPALPLTANGKVDRKALPAPGQPGRREMSAASETSAASAASAAPRTREEEILAAVWAQILRLPQVSVNDNFFELGGDSILSVQIVARARQAGLRFTTRQVFEHPTVAELARHATATNAADAGDAANAAGAAGLTPAEQGAVEGEVPLTPIQRWFFAQDFADPHHFNQALLLETREPLSPAALARAMAALVEHHDALRMRFDLDSQGEPGGWRQENAPAEPIAPFHQVDLSRLPAPRRRAACERAAAALQAGFDLAAGPLTRLCLFDLGAGQPAQLLWVAHHLVVDGVSWRLLLEDLAAAYLQAARGQRIVLPPKTTSFQEWARRLARHADSEALAAELPHWRETARVAVPRLPVDFPPDGGQEAGGIGDLGDLLGDEATVSFELGAEETTDLLQTLPAVYRSRIEEALLSALARALSGWTGSPRLRVDLEGHGREPLFDDLDVSRTVGWFTSLYPVVLEGGDAGPRDALVSAMERLRGVPGRGIGYGLLRYGNAEAARLLAEAPDAPAAPAAPAADIRFNYLGQAGATSEEGLLFEASGASAGPMQSPRAHRTYRLDVVGIVAEGRLRITLTYGTRTHRRETAERLAAAYAGALRELIRHARESEAVPEALRLAEEGVTPWSPLVPIQPLGARPPLFCVHALGGEVLSYYRLARELGVDQPVYGLQARPLNGAEAGQAEAPRVTVEELAAEYVDAVRSLQPAGPYLLAGHSFGGVAAFEMARQLKSAGEEVALLALLDQPVPAGDETAEVDTATVIADVVRHLAREQGRTLELAADALRDLPLEAQLARGLAALGSREALGPGFDLPLLRDLALGWSSRATAVERYQVSTYPGRITLLRAESVDSAALRELPAARRQVFENPTLGWDRVAAGGVEVHPVPGNHQSIVEAPHVETLAEVLGACLARATDGATEFGDAEVLSGGGAREDD